MQRSEAAEVSKAEVSKAEVAQAEVSKAEVAQAEVSKAEVAKAVSQLQQARSVLGDAVGTISQCFETLKAESQNQRRMMGELISAMAAPEAVRKHRRSPTGQPAPAQLDNPCQPRPMTAQTFARETSLVLGGFADTLVAYSEGSLQSVKHIDEMAGQLDAIFRLVKQINEISLDTFVLGVNASIQAANAAGATGHSFAAIATNVRDLSRKTQRFNVEIGEQIEKAQRTAQVVRATMADFASRDVDAALEGKRRVQGLLDQAMSFEHHTRDVVDCANEAACRIAGATSQAVTALQFEDIVTQLLGNVQQRIERLGHEPTHGATPLRNPVQQISVAAGDVELF